VGVEPPLHVNRAKLSASKGPAQVGEKPLEPLPVEGERAKRPVVLGPVEELVEEGSQGLRGIDDLLGLPHDRVEALEGCVLLGPQAVLAALNGNEPEAAGLSEPRFWTTCHSKTLQRNQKQETQVPGRPKGLPARLPAQLALGGSFIPCQIQCHHTISSS
jgi:hypothetical protein